MDQSLRAALFWIGAACAAVATVAIVRATISADPDRASAPRRRRIVEVAYAALPALALAAVLVATWRRVESGGAPAAGTTAAAAATPSSDGR